MVDKATETSKAETAEDVDIVSKAYDLHINQAIDHELERQHLHGM